VPLETVFFGTPDAALPAMDALVESKHSVVAVVSGPDRPRGRGMEIRPSPVKRRASELGLDVLQPQTLRSEVVQNQLKGLGADVFVFTAYGLIVPAQVLIMRPLGCINLHFSLLPQLRGAAPVQWALIQGLEETGATVMQMDEGLDTGPILAQDRERIEKDDTAGSLERRLAAKGGALLVRVLDSLERSSAQPTPQDDSRATYAPKLKVEDARIDWSLPAEEISARVRAFNPKPGAWGMLGPKRIKIWRTAPSNEHSTGAPGTVEIRDETILVNTGTKRLFLEEVQLEGARRMDAAEFVRGHRNLLRDQIA
jgi:methionyl-tRNA formyltransferase